MGRAGLRSYAIFNLAVLAGLSAPTVAHGESATWKEEVLLNTGEVIEVRRSQGFVQRGKAGNPFDIRSHPTRSSTYEFTYKGRFYRYEGDGGFLLLAISPSGYPVLVKNADSGAWYAKSNYQCTVPFYVQFIPDSTGKNWSWPPSIEPWLFNIPANLMRAWDGKGHIGTKFSLRDKRKQESNTDPQLEFMHRIDPAYSGDHCRKSR